MGEMMADDSYIPIILTIHADDGWDYNYCLLRELTPDEQDRIVTICNQCLTGCPDIDNYLQEIGAFDKYRWIVYDIDLMVKPSMMRIC